MDKRAYTRYEFNHSDFISMIMDYVKAHGDEPTMIRIINITNAGDKYNMIVEAVENGG